MLGEVARGLRRAAARARLRQRQREIRRAEQRPPRLLVLDVIVLEREFGLGFDHAVVVVDLVVEPQRAARLPLRVLDQLDRRRAVGDGGEGPGEIGIGDPMQRGRAVALDHEAAFLAARRQGGARVGRRLFEAAVAHDVETHIAGRAHHQLAAGRHRDRRRIVVDTVARAQARQHDRRAAGIDRRRDPGIDAEIGRRDHARPVEGGGDPLHPLAAGGEEGGDRQNEHQRAQRHRIAHGEPRRRPAGLELARRQQRAFDMGAPERLRDRIVLVGGDLVGDRGGRPVRLAAAAVEPAQAVIDRWAAAAAPAAPPPTAVTTANRTRPMARANGGSTSHRPAQENARNSPSAVASVASAGHSRSHNRLPRARLSARASRARVGLSGAVAARPNRPKAAPPPGAQENLRNQANTQAIPRPCAGSCA